MRYYPILPKDSIFALLLPLSFSTDGFEMVDFQPLRSLKLPGDPWVFFEALLLELFAVVVLSANEAFGIVSSGHAAGADNAESDSLDPVHADVLMILKLVAVLLVFIERNDKCIGSGCGVWLFSPLLMLLHNPRIVLPLGGFETCCWRVWWLAGCSHFMELHLPVCLDRQKMMLGVDCSSQIVRFAVSLGAGATSLLGRNYAGLWCHAVLYRLHHSRWPDPATPLLMPSDFVATPTEHLGLGLQFGLQLILAESDCLDLAGDFHGPLLGEAVFNQLVEMKLTFAACCRDLKLLLDEVAG
ncbi:hypothetical protein Nepgr_009344 [Nepenthes gracilis]|uniref:Uncharacterized protein n=1 Tax=Nepenthes gracilis TaxID=150966 RepID=A0AAD3SB48_NEPGR|nr:hypothetical protein Nepgr_009344 [Nepenthes gracilis]